jgi:hypothetical protein
MAIATYERTTIMWRTLIEVNINENWEPLFPLWFGEPAEPCFIIETNEVFAERTNTSSLIEMDPDTYQYLEELNVDLDSPIFKIDIEDLAKTTTWDERGDVKSFCAAAQSLLVKPGFTSSQTRIVFYRSATLETR